MLKGPTGCGKTRFLEHMAYQIEAAARDRSRATKT
jgi:MoxR-like ATPase